MKWQKAKDRQPADQQEVLIRQRSIINLAIFHETEQVFRLRDGSVVSCHGQNVQWLELIDA